MHRFLLCLLLVLLPLRGLLAAGQAGCEPLPQPVQQALQGVHEHHGMHAAADEHAPAAKPCKLCAPCCLAAAPPPVLAQGTPGVAPATRAAPAAPETWASVVPPLPDPPPRA